MHNDAHITTRNTVFFDAARPRRVILPIQK